MEGGRAGPSAGVDASRRPSVEVHPLVRDGRRRSLLTPFLAVEAVKHWDALTRQASPIKRKEVPARAKSDLAHRLQQSTTKTFLVEVGTVLSDSGATDVDCITALASLLKGLVSESKSRRITGKEIFAHRLVPILSAIASYNSAPRFTCTHCNNPNCQASTSAKRMAAMSVLCGVISEPGISSLCIEWGLAALLLECAVKGFVHLSKCAELNSQFRRKFQGLDASVAVHPDAGHANTNSDQLYRVPMLCMRALRCLCQSVFPRGSESQLTKFNLKQTQLIQSYMIEGTALPVGWTPDKTDGLEWVCIDESVSKDVDYYEINQWNYQGFQEMLAAKEFANLPSGGALAPKPKIDFLFRVACKSSVGYGESSSTEVVSLGEQEDEKAQEDETDEILPVLPPMPMPSRRRRMKKGHIEMYKFKF
eukprot:g915.t1